MQIEDVFSSKLRMKILKIIAHFGELNVSQIARRLNANYQTTNNHLKILEEESVLKRKVFGRIRLYRFNKYSLKTKAIQNLIDIWEHVNR